MRLLRERAGMDLHALKHLAAGVIARRETVSPSGIETEPRGRGRGRPARMIQMGREVKALSRRAINKIDRSYRDDAEAGALPVLLAAATAAAHEEGWAQVRAASQ